MISSKSREIYRTQRFTVLMNPLSSLTNHPSTGFHVACLKTNTALGIQIKAKHENIVIFAVAVDNQAENQACNPTRTGPAGHNYQIFKPHFMNY